MARFGTGINPSLGRIDYTPYMQGAIAGGQSIAQGIASLGQAAGNAIRDYKKKKEEEQNIANTIFSKPTLRKIQLPILYLQIKMGTLMKMPQKQLLAALAPMA
jgi:hypothetical protein